MYAYDTSLEFTKMPTLAANHYMDNDRAYVSPAFANASERLLRNSLFSSEDMSHSDSHLSTSARESCNASRSVLVLAISNSVW